MNNFSFYIRRNCYIGYQHFVRRLRFVVSLLLHPDKRHLTCSLGKSTIGESLFVSDNKSYYPRGYSNRRYNFHATPALLKNRSFQRDVHRILSQVCTYTKHKCVCISRLTKELHQVQISRTVGAESMYNYLLLAEGTLDTY